MTIGFKTIEDTYTKYGYILFEKPFYEDVDYDFYVKRYYASLESAKEGASGFRSLGIDTEGLPLSDIVWNDDEDNEYFYGYYITWISEDEYNSPKPVIAEFRIERVQIG